MSLTNSFDKTSLDVENPLPSGGPNNFPHLAQGNHQHLYHPYNQYTSTYQLIASSISGFGINGTPAVLSPTNIFNTGTSLDVEDPSPSGGPNHFPHLTLNGVHQHKFHPHKQYLDTRALSHEPNSDFGIVGSFFSTTLSSTFNIFKDGTGLDVEDNGAGGGPNNFPQWTLNNQHSHQYHPHNKYGDTRSPSLSRETISEFGTDGTTISPTNIFKDGTNLDVEDPNISGGPNNFPQFTLNNQHEHKYTPHNTYLSVNTLHHTGTGNMNIHHSQISEFGTNGTALAPTNIFKDETKLDIEDAGAGGGPNRMNPGLNNIPTGNYFLNGSSQNGTQQSPQPLLDENGNAIQLQLHRYLPNQTYLDSL